MAIRWNAAAVMDVCDEADAELAKALPYLDLAKPHLEKAARILAEVRKVDNMPQYITQPLGWAEEGVRSDYKHFCDSVPASIQTIRDKVPAQEAARTRYKGKAVRLAIKVAEAPRGVSAGYSNRIYENYCRDRQSQGRPTVLALERRR